MDWPPTGKVDVWLESFVLGWFPAEESESAEEERAAGELDNLPEGLAAFHRLTRLRPAIHRFIDPVLKKPRRASGPLGDRLVFAMWYEAGKDWSIPWPLENPGDEDEAVVGFSALHRGTLTPLLEHELCWVHFDG
ncbi:hypothetical protein ACFZAR_30300 [Streptomyces sp. NPDC008222]|uniref:hypothetical protein n=1 Tax=Streptomyces sp. NPDC008222 TaxID=3364820 RepID=UPI0036F110BA